MLSKFILFHIGGLLALLIGLNLAVSANEMNEYQLSYCGRVECVRLESPKAWQSKITSNFAFATAKLTIFDHDGKHVKEIIEAKDVYYDAYLEKIMIHEPVKGPRGEAYYDLKSEKLVRLPARPVAVAGD